MIIGLTGGIGSGKSTALIILTAAGISCIDADDIIQRLYSPGSAIFNDILAVTGSSVLTSGKIDLDKLREFHLPEAINQDIIKLIWEEVKALEVTEGTVIFVSARIIEESFPVDKLWVITCPPEVQVARALKRGVDEIALEKIILKQLSLAKRLERADSIIENTGDLQALSDNLKPLIVQLTKQTNHESIY